MSSFYSYSTPYSLPFNKQRALFSLSSSIWNISFPSLSFPFKPSVTLTAPTLMLLLACSPSPVSLPVIRRVKPLLGDAGMSLPEGSCVFSSSPAEPMAKGW